MQISLTASQDQICKFLLKDLEKSEKQNQGLNHTLILGVRGQGKTTLLRKLFEKVGKDKTFKKTYSASYISFIYGMDEVDKVIDTVMAQSNLAASERQNLIFIDDIDNLLGDSEVQAHALRKILTRKNPRITILATADSDFKQSLSHSKAFFGFFRVLEL